MKRGWIATVQLLLPDRDSNGTLLDTPVKAADAVSAIFREDATQHGRIVDWAYLKVGGQILQPAEKHYDAARYQEGEAFD